MKAKEELKQSDWFARGLQKGNWWKKGNECLNMHDINKPPKYYTGTEKQWIEELTTYIFLYPAEWKSIYEQYQALSKEDWMGETGKEAFGERGASKGLQREAAMEWRRLAMQFQMKSLAFKVKIGWMKSNGSEMRWDHN